MSTARKWPVSFSVAALLGLLGMSDSQAIPVFDGMNYYIQSIKLTEQRLANSQLVQQTRNGLQQIQQQRLQLEQLRASYVQLMQMKNSLSGKNAYGAISTGVSMLNDQSYLPTTMDSASADWKSGKGDAGKYATEYQNKYPNQDAKKLYQYDPSGEQATAYQDSATATMGLESTSKSIYANLQKHVVSIDKLNKQIDQTTDTKKALDLNNALLAELASMMADDMRLKTLQAHAQALETQRSLTSEAQSQRRNKANLSKTDMGGSNTTAPADINGQTNNVPYNPYK